MEFWNHRFNRMPVRAYELCDELTRTGNLFVLLSTDDSGMTFVRPVPATDIERIEAAPNDIEQPIRFWPKAGADSLNPEPYPAYDEDQDQLEAGDRPFRTVMLHYTINRPVGGQWGESDLAPILKWLARYSNWLEDRARLNRFRNSFVWVVKARFASGSRARCPPGPAGGQPAPTRVHPGHRRDRNLGGRQPQARGIRGQHRWPGAQEDDRSPASGIPMHFLAEPESSTRTTAEAAGGPTFRHFEQRQNYFMWVIGDIVKIATSRRALVDSHVSKTGHARDPRGRYLRPRQCFSVHGRPEHHQPAG